MLVMAGATADVVLKQIIKQCIGPLIDINEKTKDEALKIISRRVFTTIDKQGGKRLAEALLSDDPKGHLISIIISDVTGDSLQSDGEVRKVAQLLGPASSVSIADLNPAFQARNQIIHELDSTIGSAGLKNRRQRRKTVMLEHAKSLLDATASILSATDKALDCSVKNE